MPQANPETSNVNPAMFVPRKLTYEEFLREYDGRYAEYVNGKVILPMSVTQRHDNLTSFLRAILRFYVEAKIWEEYAANLAR